MNAMTRRDASDLKRCEILVVEPDDDRRTRLSRLIHRAGARVTTAANGHEAIPLACLGVYEVVVIGTVIPDMEGAEFVRSIKSLSPWTQTVQLAEDGSPVEKDVGELDEERQDPFAEERVLKIIRAVLERAELRARGPQ
jgi:DNA-binding NtrC family response regulator